LPTNPLWLDQEVLALKTEGHSLRTIFVTGVSEFAGSPILRGLLAQHPEDGVTGLGNQRRATAETSRDPLAA